MILIERQKPSHWYLQDGMPFHEIQRASGIGLRPATLADARKVHALPSVTNVLGVLAKPGLDAWKIEQGILSALTLPRLAGECDDVFARRVVVDIDGQVEKAADFGTAIHAACELYAQEKALPADPILLAHIADWRRWFDENIERVDCLESVFVNRELGYAGRVDLIAKVKGLGRGVIDWKTQNIKRSAKGVLKPVFYETWPLQLSAYRMAALASLARPIDFTMSVVINSAEPGPVHVQMWSDLVMAKQFAAFKAALDLWKYVKDYNPGKTEPF